MKNDDWGFCWLRRLLRIEFFSIRTRFVCSELTFEKSRTKRKAIKYPATTTTMKMLEFLHSQLQPTIKIKTQAPSKTCEWEAIRVLLSEVRNEKSNSGKNIKIDLEISVKQIWSQLDSLLNILPTLKTIRSQQQHVINARCLGVLLARRIESRERGWRNQKKYFIDDWAS